MEALGRRVKESSVVLPTLMPATDTPKLKAAAWKHIGWSLIHVPGEKRKLLAEAGNVCLRKGCGIIRCGWLVSGTSYPQGASESEGLYPPIFKRNQSSRFLKNLELPDI